MTEKPRIQVAAGLIQEGNGYLITKRKAGVHLEGFWEFPGGKREPGESLEECLARELKEELDICITPPTPFHVITHDYPDKSVELHFFLCSIRGGSPQALDCDDWRWVSAEDLARYTFPPADQPVILLVQQYAKQKASGMTS